MKRGKNIALKILTLVSIFFIIIGLYALSSNLFWKETTGEITYCSRVYDWRRDNIYWDASAKFYLKGKEYSGKVHVDSHKYVGQKIAILYNPKNPNDFINKDSSYVGIITILFGIVFLIPSISFRKNKKRAQLEKN